MLTVIVQSNTISEHLLSKHAVLLPFYSTKYCSMPGEIVIDPAKFTVTQRQKIMTRVSAKCEATGSNCLMWTKATNSSGYPQMRITMPDGSYKLVLVSRVVFAFTHDMILGGAPNIRMHMSHLCHERLCLFPGHIVLEPLEVNNDRRTCMSRRFCHGFHNWQGENYPSCIF